MQNILMGNLRCGCIGTWIFPSFNGTCDEFILSVTELVVDPMLSFVPKETAVKVGNQNQKLRLSYGKTTQGSSFSYCRKGGRTFSEGKCFHIAKGGGKIKLYLQYTPWPSEKRNWKGTF